MHLKYIKPFTGSVLRVQILVKGSRLLEVRSWQQLLKMFIRIYLLWLHFSALVDHLQAEYTINCWKLLKLKLIYDRQSVGQSVLVSGAHLGPATKFSFSLKFPSDSCGFVIL
jgi:hypothetical protein